MGKIILVSCFLLLTSYFLLLSSASADPGIVIEAKGKVTIVQGGKTTTAQTGAQFADGATIEVASGGSATLMFSNGAIKKLASGEKLTVAKSAPGGSAGTPLIKGLAMAYNDATGAKKGPTVHGMVKAVPSAGSGQVPGQKAAAKGCDTKLDPERTRQMQADLNQINSLGLDRDGKALMQAQVYYKYQQHQKMVNVLLPVYKSQSARGGPPTEMVKNLLALGYEKMGKPEEAARYR